MAAEPPTHRAAVLGSPIAHSLSPVLHRAGYAAAGLSGWRYDAVEVDEAGLVGFVAGLDRSWRGLSLTMPLKEVAFSVATGVSETARRAGAVNTLVRRGDGGWDADNTDVPGLVAALGGVAHAGQARVVGAGATARSAVLALHELGVRHLDVAARRPEAAAALTAFAAELGMAAGTVPLEAWAHRPPPLVVSTVPAPAGPELVRVLADVAGPLELTLFDVVYAPWPSPLAAAVETRGGRTISGLEMLIHQAALQFQLFTGVSGDVAAMRAAAEALR